MTAHTTKNAGFSLIELSILLLILGLVVTVGVQYLWAKMGAESVKTTGSHIRSVEAALEAYYFETGYYPWPANPALVEGNANFGRQDTAIAPTPAPAEVVQGAVPFVDLKIPAAYALDGWNNKLTYAVSLSQTAPAPPSTAPMPATGSITATIADQPDPNVDEYFEMEKTGIHWVLISHGNLGRGAYTVAGVRIPCPTAAAAPRERDNCDDDDHFYMSGKDGSPLVFRSLANNASYLDDYTAYTDKVFSRYWISPINTPGGQSNAVNTAGVVGINTDQPGKDMTGLDPVTGAEIWTANGVDFDVDGTVRANAQGFAPTDQKGTANSLKYCGADGSDCFGAEKIGGVGLQDCVFLTNAGQPKAGMSGIKMNGASCIDAMNNFTVGTCPSGLYMTGLTAAGAPICGN